VRQPPGHAVARRSLASAAATPPGELAGLDDPAGQHRTTGLDPLTRDLQAELAKTAERVRVRAHEGSVRRVAPVGCAGLAVRPPDLSFACAVRAALSAIRLGHD
jgi:hypothetical protein